MSARMYEFVEDSSDKFWEIDVKGSAFNVRWGRRGTDGQRQTKEFSSNAEAKTQAEKLIAEKLKKGYIETTGDAAPAIDASWAHPQWGEFEHDGMGWTATISMPSFAQFSYDTGFPNARKSKGKHELNFTCDDGQKPTPAQVKLAEAVVANQAELVKTIAKALWDDFNGDGPGSGMYWNDNLDELAEGMDSPEDAPEKTEDVLKLLQVSSVNVHPKDDDRPAMVEICFHAAFEDEHGVGVLTNGKKVLGIGYMSDVQPFEE